MMRTRLSFTMAPNSKLNPYKLAKFIASWADLAAKLEKKLAPKEDEAIFWELVFNWRPDDDEEAEMVSQYQPLMFTRCIQLIKTDTLYPIATCGEYVEFRAGGYHANATGPCSPIDDELVDFLTERLQKQQ